MHAIITVICGSRSRQFITLNCTNCKKFNRNSDNNDNYYYFIPIIIYFISMTYQFEIDKLIASYYLKNFQENILTFNSPLLSFLYVSL